MLVHRSTSEMDVGYILKYNYACYIVVLIMCTYVIMNERVQIISILALQNIQCECHAVSSNNCTVACAFTCACVAVTAAR